MAAAPEWSSKRSDETGSGVAKLGEHVLALDPEHPDRVDPG
jgi:hypothetical protein